MPTILDCEFLAKYEQGCLGKVVSLADYIFAMRRDVSGVRDFYSEMRPGLDVHKVAKIANKYGAGFRQVRDPSIVDNHELRSKLTGQDNTWFFAVGELTTIGKRACDVRHENKQILSTDFV